MVAAGIYQKGRGEEAEMNQELQYTIVDGDKIEGEGRITNISLKKNARKWNMASLDDFFIFTIKFAGPSTVAYIDIKGHNSHLVTLIFKDHLEKFILEKEFQFNPHDEAKIIEVWERPLTSFVDVKLLNSSHDRRKIGLNYLNFLGKCHIVQSVGAASTTGALSVSKATVISKKPEEKMPISINIDDEEVNRILDLDADPLESVHRHAQDIYFEDEEQHTDTPNTNAHVPHAATAPNVEEPQRQQTQASTKGRQSVNPIEIEPDSLIQPAFSEEVHELTEEELATAILEDPPMDRPYVTYPYEQAGEWWGILKMVRKDWVQAQTNVENEKGVKAEDRMSSRIAVQHLYRRRVLVEGFERERRDMNEQTAAGMGATILREVEPGCIVVTSREYGEKIRRMKKFKNSKIVTEEYVLNCKRFDRLLNEDDYLIR